MSTRTFKTIADLHKAVQCGEIDERMLAITLDNDATGFAVGPFEYNDDGDMIRGDTIEVTEANGYYDVEPLYRLLFPIADVDWC